MRIQDIIDQTLSICTAALIRVNKVNFIYCESNSTEGVEISVTVFYTRKYMGLWNFTANQYDYQDGQSLDPLFKSIERIIKDDVANEDKGNTKLKTKVNSIKL